MGGGGFGEGERFGLGFGVDVGDLVWGVLDEALLGEGVVE